MKISPEKLRQTKKNVARKIGEDFTAGKKMNGEAGFSLIEVIGAMVILLIVLLGVFVTFTYSINYNAGNSSRSQALSVLQREVEKMRSKRFTNDPVDGTDPDLYGGVKADRTETYLNGNKFNISISIDNNPATPAIDSDESVKPSIKQIKVTVTLDRPTPGWQTAIPISVILQRVRGN